LDSAILIPEAKPAFELIDGRLVQKMSPKRRHQWLAKRWADALEAWSGEPGNALTEWRVNFRAPGRRWGSLVPDVAYFSSESLARLTPAEAEEPPIAPDVAVEIVSAGDSPSDLEWKIGAYLAAGTLLVIVVDPPARRVAAHATDSVGVFDHGDTFMHASLPNFSYKLEDMFAGLYLD
jgi:Uma2 family endonuclease